MSSAESLPVWVPKGDLGGRSPEGQSYNLLLPAPSRRQAVPTQDMSTPARGETETAGP